VSSHGVEGWKRIVFAKGIAQRLRSSLRRKDATTDSTGDWTVPSTSFEAGASDKPRLARMAKRYFGLKKLSGRYCFTMCGWAGRAPNWLSDYQAWIAICAKTRGRKSPRTISPLILYR
jgi:hypothetical protein